MGPTDEVEELQDELSDIRRALLSAMFVWPLFAVLDVLGTSLWNEGHGVVVVLTTRIAGMAGLVTAYVAIRTTRLTPRSVTVIDLAICAVFGAIVGTMGILLGGLPSRAFAGVCLILAFRAGVYPSHWKRALAAVSVCALGWPGALGIGALFDARVRGQWMSRTSIAEFAYGMVFILFGVGLFTAVSHFVWSARREVRIKSRQLAENRAELASKVAQLESNNVELKELNEELAQSNHRADRIFTALAEALPGKVLDGKYQLRDRIGAGGFGVVFRATHLVLRRPVAVKVFRPTAGNDSAAALERFRREAISACLVRHPNAVTVFDSGISSEQIPYLVMELLEGESLASLLARERRVGWRRCFSIAIPVCDALQVAHARGIVHRDVKPENVFLHREPAGEIVKVVDFGIAALVGTHDAATEAKRLTATNVIIGTPAYVAPERVVGDPYDGRADVYSVGVLIYEMLTGHLPIEHEARVIGIAAFVRQATQSARPLTDWLPEVPDDLEHLVSRALARDPVARPTAGALANELRALERVSLHGRAVAP